MRRERDGMLVVLYVALFGALVLIFSYRAQVVALKQDIYRQCVGRQQYDASSQHVRAVSRDYWLGVMDAERNNKFIDANLRAQRVAGAQRMVDALNDTLKTTVRGGCAQYRP